jgi:hypothetical protein
MSAVGKERDPWNFEELRDFKVHERRERYSHRPVEAGQPTLGHSKTSSPS